MLLCVQLDCTKPEPATPPALPHLSLEQSRGWTPQITLRKKIRKLKIKKRPQNASAQGKKSWLGNGFMCWRQPGRTEWWKGTEGNWLRQSRDCLTGQTCPADSGWSRQLRKSFHWDHAPFCPARSEWNLARAAESVCNSHEEFSLLHLQVEETQSRTWTSLRTEWDPAFYTLPFLKDFSSRICLIKSWVESKKIWENDSL